MEILEPVSSGIPSINDFGNFEIQVSWDPCVEEFGIPITADAGKPFENPTGAENLNTISNTNQTQKKLVGDTQNLTNSLKQTNRYCEPTKNNKQRQCA